MLMTSALFAAGESSSNEIASIKTNVEVVERKVDYLETEINLLENHVDQLSGCISMSNEVVANGLSTSNFLVSVFAALFAVGAIILGVHVSRISKKVEGLNKEVAKKEDAVREMSKEIQNDFDNLFSKIRRADTKALLSRLVSVPQDLSNIANILLARDLDHDDYLLLRSAYEHLLSSGDEGMRFDVYGNTLGDEYVVLFLQHFPADTIKDPLLQVKMLPILENWVASSAFPNDLIKVAKDVAPVLKDSSTPLDRLQFVLLFRKGLYKSRYNNNENIIDSIKDGIDNNALWDEAGKMISKRVV